MQVATLPRLAREDVVVTTSVARGRTDRNRALIGTVAGLASVVALVALLSPFRASLTTASPALVLMVPVVVAAVLGGRGAAIVTAVAAVGAFDVAFLAPRGTFDIHAADDVIAVIVFGLVAVVLGSLVAREHERRGVAEAHATELEAAHAALAAAEHDRMRLEEEARRAEALEVVDEQRSALLRSVSHDLRTPLAAIRAVATDLLAGGDYDDDTRTELLNVVADEAERLDRLVANLLNLSRIEAGALRPEQTDVDVEELVTDTARRLGRVLAPFRLEFSLPPDLPSVCGDYTQLRQVVSNVLENAARHAPAGSTVVIGARPRPDEVEVWIADEGPGIVPFERHRIFEPFQSGAKSTGIGLAICRAIIEAHGGRIEADDAPGGGARVSFTIPRRHARR